MSRYDVEFNCQQAAIANAEYEELKKEARRKGRPHSVTREKISRKHGRHPKWLKYYRTNHLSPSRAAANRKKYDTNRTSHRVLPRASHHPK